MWFVATKLTGASAQTRPGASLAVATLLSTAMTARARTWAATKQKGWSNHFPTYELASEAAECAGAVAYIW